MFLSIISKKSGKQKKQYFKQRWTAFDKEKKNEQFLL